MFTHIKSVKAGGLMLENDYLEDELKALKLAIEMELKIRKFYISHAKKMKNDIAKKTFIFLANEELKHIDAIKAFNKAVHKGKETIIEDETKEEAIDKGRGFFAESIRLIANQIKASDDEIKIYELGLKTEKKGYDFYKHVAQQAEHPNVKKLFEFLMKEENAHYALLSNALDYLKQPENWFQDQESWFFEGG